MLKLTVRLPAFAGGNSELAGQDQSCRRIPHRKMPLDSPSVRLAFATVSVGHTYTLLA
jgi:hypothetical protein